MRRQEIMNRKFERKKNRWCWILTKSGVMYKGIISKVRTQKVFLRSTKALIKGDTSFDSMILSKQKRKKRGNRKSGVSEIQVVIEFREVDLYGCE